MLEIQDLHFTYPRGRKAVAIEGINLRVANGEHLALIGESGCGKSTLLKLIYGLHDPDGGHILYNGAAVLGPKYKLIAGMDHMKYLAQDFDLMPFITVAENVGKYLSNIYRDQKAERVNELLELVEMTEYAQTKAEFLSGGQQQRVALARVLALEPQLLLLDEPFSQIDAFRRNALRRKLFRHLKQHQIGCVFATHDATDILAFADAVAVLRHGALVQTGTPQQIYRNPNDAYTAGLFGEVSVIPQSWIGDDPGDQSLYFYPDQLIVVAHSQLEAEVVQSYGRGFDFLVEATLRGRPVFFKSSVARAPGSHCFLAPQWPNS